MSSKDKNITGISIYIKLDYWYVSHSVWNWYTTFILQLIQTLPTLYFVLKLEQHINVRRYFDSSKVRGEGNSVIFINREILPGPEDARICFTKHKIQWCCLFLFVLIFKINIYIGWDWSFKTKFYLSFPIMYKVKLVHTCICRRQV